MSPWPAICSYCGAPLMNNRCPRCNYQRQKAGQSVLSGIESFAGSPLFTTTIRGSNAVVDAPVTSFTIPNVTVEEGESLFLCFGTKATALVSIPTANITWGAVTPAAAALLNVPLATPTYKGGCYYWSRPTSGTATVTINFTGANKPTDVAGIAITVKRTPTGALLFTNSLSPATEEVGSTSFDSLNSDPTPAPSFVIGAHVTGGGIADDEGSWSAPTRRLLRIGTNGVTVDVCFREYAETVGPEVAKTNFTSRVWALPIGAFLGESS